MFKQNNINSVENGYKTVKKPSSVGELIGEGFIACCSIALLCKVACGGAEEHSGAPLLIMAVPVLSGMSLWGTTTWLKAYRMYYSNTVEKPSTIIKINYILDWFYHILFNPLSFMIEFFIILFLFYS